MQVFVVNIYEISYGLFFQQKGFGKVGVHQNMMVFKGFKYAFEIHNPQFIKLTFMFTSQNIVTRCNRKALSNELEIII